MSKFVDHAFPILQGDPALTSAGRADIWDHFHQSGNATELAQRLQNVAMPDDTRAQLISAKSKPSTELDNLDRVVRAIHKLSAMDSKDLEIAESHPRMLQHLIDAETEARSTVQPAAENQ
jgi:hypothetical protein